MNALLRRILGRGDRETCPYCLDRVPTGRLTIHCETNHAGDEQE